MCELFVSLVIYQHALQMIIWGKTQPDHIPTK